MSGILGTSTNGMLIRGYVSVILGGGIYYCESALRETGKNLVSSGDARNNLSAPRQYTAPNSLIMWDLKILDKQLI